MFTQLQYRLQMIEENPPVNCLYNDTVYRGELIPAKNCVGIIRSTVISDTTQWFKYDVNVVDEIIPNVPIYTEQEEMDQLLDQLFTGNDEMILDLDAQQTQLSLSPIVKTPRYTNASSLASQSSTQPLNTAFQAHQRVF